MEWGREEEREAEKVGVEEIQSAVKLKDGKKGRIICFKANVGGRIGSKLAILLETINLALSSPPLSTDILQSSKAYLYLIPSLTNAHREKIVGCVIAQRISTAMTVAAPSETLLERDSNQVTDRDLLSSSPTHRLVAVDTTSGLFCHPEALPTPLGIPRLFVSSAHRRQGIASRLLSAAAATFIHGCPLDPVSGDVAFTQPTEGGHAVMLNWGGGGVRIYEE
jgi:N-acetyltransferase